MKIPNLRSPREQVSGMVYFGRMLDKIRIHAQGGLPPDYVENLGGGFDGWCCDYLRINYESFVSMVKSEPALSDEQLLTWAMSSGRELSERDLTIWNNFMTKRGWRDEVHDRLVFRLKEAGLPDDGIIKTMFDFIDHDEGRPLPADGSPS